MGNSRSRSVKRIGDQFLEQYLDSFTIEYYPNRDFIREHLIEYEPKKDKGLINKVAAYVTIYRQKLESVTIHGSRLPTPPRKKSSRKRKRRGY